LVVFDESILTCCNNANHQVRGLICDHGRVTGTPTSVDELTALNRLNELTEPTRRTRYLYFWGHQPQRDGTAGPGCLSQWYPAGFDVDGRRYATAEHWMMWRKAVLFGDQERAAQILAVPHPNAAKTLGARVRDFDEAVWARERFEIVVAGNRAKFARHADLGDFLVATGDHVLVEASPRDRVWGIGLAAGDERAADPATWLGLNLLGFALMRVRAELAAG
jgi:ribA/ribD-fused uncharacterized protein